MNPVPNHQTFARTELDDLTNEQVDQLLNQATQIKKGRASAKPFTAPTAPPQNKVVDLSAVLGGLGVEWKNHG